MPKKELFGLCPYMTSQKVLTGKWSMYILYLLSQESPIRFNELQRKMPVEKILSKLSGKITSEEMSRMNYQVDVEGKKAFDVAREYLVSENLISE